MVKHKIEMSTGYVPLVTTRGCSRNFSRRCYMVANPKTN